MREHLRNKFLTAEPETKVWKDNDGDVVILVAPPDSMVREDRRRYEDGKITEEEWGARLIVLMAHEPKTTIEGELVTRNGKPAYGEPIFTDRDTKELVQQPLGSIIGRLRTDVVLYLNELASNTTGPTRDDLVGVIKRSIEIIDADEGEEHNEKALASLRERFAKIVEEEEGKG